MYFSIIPDLAYDEKPINSPFSTSDFTVAKNFFRRYKINDDIFSNVVYFNKYAIKDGERPDVLARNFYGNQFYDWVILLTNNMVNAQYDWPMNNYELYRVLEQEFDDPYSQINHYEIKQSMGHYAAGLHVDQTFYNGQHKLNIDGVMTLKNGNEICSPITVAEYYQEENDKKREIYLLKKQYLQSFVDDFRKQNLYKKDTNYISQRLKKTG
jgi:hypothetical protein|tara:strand:+ start:2141 stop:2773 length:633 start_codon:yes stop_codon:yes gene_type:complete